MNETADKPQFKVTKDISEVYRIRLDSYRCQWANITINNEGDLNVISDCGNFAYAWRSFGKNFKDFLIEICSKASSGRGSYLYGKIHDRERANRIDTEETIKQLKRELFQYYREKRRDYWFMEKDKKKIYPQLDVRMRDAYDEIESIESEGNLSPDAFMSLLWNSSHLDEVFNGDYLHESLDVTTLGDQNAIAFCEVVAPVFAEILRQEVEGGKTL